MNAISLPLSYKMKYAVDAATFESTVKSFKESFAFEESCTRTALLVDPQNQTTQTVEINVKTEFYKGHIVTQCPLDNVKDLVGFLSGDEIFKLPVISKTGINNEAAIYFATDMLSRGEQREGTYPVLNNSINMLMDGSDRRILVIGAVKLYHEATDVFYQDIKDPDEAYGEKIEFTFKKLRKCATCNAFATNMKTCGGCKAYHYCNKQCARRHWTEGGHKEACTFSIK